MNEAPIQAVLRNETTTRYYRTAAHRGGGGDTYLYLRNCVTAVSRIFNGRRTSTLLYKPFQSDMKHYPSIFQELLSSPRLAEVPISPQGD